MAYCPECHKNWPEGVVLCRDCRASLVDELEPPGVVARLTAGLTGADVEWVELAELRPVPNPTTAAMWKGALESQGLSPVIRSHAIPAYGDVLRDWTTRSWGTLLVPREELDEARAVLDDFLRTAAIQAPEEDEDDEDEEADGSDPS